MNEYGYGGKAPGYKIHGSGYWLRMSWYLVVALWACFLVSLIGLVVPGIGWWPVVVQVIIFIPLVYTWAKAAEARRRGDYSDR